MHAHLTHSKTIFSLSIPALLLTLLVGCGPGKIAPKNLAQNQVTGEDQSDFVEVSPDKPTPQNLTTLHLGTHNFEQDDLEKIYLSISAETKIITTAPASATLKIIQKKLGRLSCEKWIPLDTNQQPFEKEISFNCDLNVSDNVDLNSQDQTLYRDLQAIEFPRVTEAGRSVTEKRIGIFYCIKDEEHYHCGSH